MSNDSENDTDERGPLPPIPDSLLAPLLDAAGEALRGLQPMDLPPAGRRLRAFDRRGLATPAARLQLRRLLQAEDGLLAGAAELLLGRPEAARLATAWDEAIAAGGDAPLTLVGEQAGQGRLPLLASVLTAGLPDGVEFGLGLVLATAAASDRESGVSDAIRAATAAQAAAEEARRRAEAGRTAAEAEAARLDAVLREERRARREQEQRSGATVAGSQAELGRLIAAVAAAEERADAAERHAARAEEVAAGAERRAAGAEHRAAEAERRAAEAEQWADAAERRAGTGDRGPSGAAHGTQGDVDRLALDRAAEAAEDLAVRLRRLAGHQRPGSADGTPPERASRPAGARPGRPNPPAPAAAPSARRAPSPPPVRAAPTRRAPVHVPPGMLQDDPAAVAAMVRTPGVAVIVDGYNVSMLAWPDTSPAEQRERLCDALAEFQLRTRSEVTVVFDGAEVPGVRPLRRRGLRVVFSAAGQEADEVVVDEVMFRPAEVPVIVVSSDREVQAAAESEGATVLASDTFLQLMRR